MVLIKFALGHHLDDIIETAVLNLINHGIFVGMKPVRHYFNNRLQIIRPMCEVKESQIRKIQMSCHLPVISAKCPYAEKTQRIGMKKIIRSMAHLNKNARTNIYKAIFHTNDEK